MTIIYHDEHGTLDALNGKTVGIIGYGSLGRPFALNLRDNGVQLMIGARTEQTAQIALEDGLSVRSVAECVAVADVVVLMLPDDVMPQVYLEQVSPYLRRGQLLIFGSAYNVTYRFIEPPPFVDVGLIAPRTLGQGVREQFQNGLGFQSFVSIGQDATGQAWTLLLAVAKGMGALQGGAIEVSFEQEAELDLFVQQTVLPVLHHLLTSAADLLLARGYPPEAVFTELYLSGELSGYLQQVASSGLLNTLRTTPLTNQYGMASRLERFSDVKLERLMEATLKEIHSGEYAREWAREGQDGNRRLNAFYRAQDKLERWELEQQTLDLLGRSDDM